MAARPHKRVTESNSPFDDWFKSIFGGLSPWLLSLIKEGLRWLGVLLTIIVIVKIVYHCILNNVVKMNHNVLVVQKEKGGIVGEWLRSLMIQF